MHWFMKVILCLVAGCALWGTGPAGAHAAMRDQPPSPVRIANELGRRLAISPHVMYPPDNIRCWWPATDRYGFECESYRMDVTDLGWTEYDKVYGVKVKLYEDRSWTISWKLIGAIKSFTGRPS